MKSWRAHILFSSLALASTLAQSQQQVLDPATAAKLQQHNEVLKTDPASLGKQLDPATLKRLEQQSRSPASPRSILGKSTVEAASKDPMSAITGGENPIAKELENVTTVVFISESIPAQTLAPIIQAGLGRKDVIYLLRGWKGEGKDLMPMVMRLREKAGIKITGPQPSIYVLPKAFRVYDIQRVPAYVIKSKAHGWRGLMGNVSLKVANDEIEAGRFGKTIGTTWAVAEPDKAREYEEKLRNTPPEVYAQQKAQMRKDAEAVFTKGYDLPRAKQASTRSFDPSVALDRDIVIEGRTVGRKGQRVNALAADPKGQRFYAAIDATDPWQLDLAKQWASKYPSLMVFYTRRDNKLNELQVPAYPALKDPLARLGITEIPALSSQDGLNMRVQTFTK